ncbi:hypothetical protein JAO76_10765 [Pontibacter sp. BT310]|uniref:Uncharacterized protein n=1 Tax=Pontibacter populi TaxID=890055 RepID=A0ABS6XCE8_9BACT|nr:MULTISPECIES: hypothetical protein [Pontibacter]MBJ6118677.1 hypothetical protein [Pontibacter sp. BT310]MBR0571106.1 hypothetical protein [Microvirga sp. STS03]MBW3365531.1 hypothetical protein [Pontibacter populi]
MVNRKAKPTPIRNFTLRKTNHFCSFIKANRKWKTGMQPTPDGEKLLPEKNAE